RFFLLRRDLVVEVNRRSPVSLQDVAGDVRDHGDRSSRDIDTVNRSLVEMPGDDGVAGAVIRVLADPARAQDGTAAHFEESSFEMICHGDTSDLLLLWGCRRSRSCTGVAMVRSPAADSQVNIRRE